MRRVSGSLIFGWTQPLGGRPCPSPFPRWRDVLSLGCGVWRQCLRMGGTLGPCTGVGGSPGPGAPFPSFSGPSVPAQIVWESPDVWTLRSRSRQVAEQSRLSGLSPERHPTSNSHAAPDADAPAALPWRRRRTPSPPALRAPARLSAPAEGAHARRSISCFTSKMSCVATTLNRREVTVCQHVGLWLIIVFL